ncbi:cytochrome d1 heme region [hydrothermal vent metagenome]|uniref:Cytochrome d1 heme region n=1 Tax=hydrothermal vent metagenome TaxID=652676 RepID=A0A1W1BU62_9ZZZZ
MIERIVVIFFFIAVSTLFGAHQKEGEKLFKEYCWGCHHQTAEAFGPSFRTIANKRTRAEIMAQIADPQGTYKDLGYKRNSMPSFGDLSASELQALTDYIITFKDKK